MDVSVKITPVITGKDAKRILDKLENPAPLTEQEKINSERIKKTGHEFWAGRIVL